MLNAQYTLARPDSLAIRMAVRQRRLMFSRFVARVGDPARDTVLDVGVASDGDYAHSNYLESWYANPANITAVGIDDDADWARRFPGITRIKADARCLPLEAGSFDHVHSSAVIEHVGGFDQQVAFMRELWRVARKGIFVTTPNRWFPIELHTMLPVIHWLPRPMHRSLLRQLGLTEFATEENLNLLSAADLATVARAAGLTDFQVEKVNAFGFASNLVLHGRK